MFLIMLFQIEWVRRLIEIIEMIFHGNQSFLNILEYKFHTFIEKLEKDTLEIWIEHVEIHTKSISELGNKYILVGEKKD